MKSFHLIVLLLFIMLQSHAANALERPDVEFKIFQFPQDQMPRIDGDTGDWNIVPDSYAIGLDQLVDTTYNMPTDPKDKDITVTVGWVKDMNRLYFLVEAYDDYWDFSDPGLHNDILELVVDGDLSGGGFIPRHHPADSLVSRWIQYSKFHGVQAQNYHVYMPAEGKPWTFIWGCQPWVYHFPYANAASSYDFKHGESGDYTLEFWITPFDYAAYEGPERSTVSKLREDTIIGLSWSVLEYDGTHDTGRFKAFWNLSHKSSMLGNATDLCAFRLMTLEENFRDKIRADWSFTIIDHDRRTVAFKDLSVGDIRSWVWDFGDGTQSNERNPIHVYEEAGYYNTVSLTIESADGSSRMARVSDVAIK